MRKAPEMGHIGPSSVFLTGSTGLSGCLFFHGFRMNPRKATSALAERKAIESITGDLFLTVEL
jgi:hypothetical protein